MPVACWQCKLELLPLCAYHMFIFHIGLFYGLHVLWGCYGASQMVLVVKNLPANAGDIRDVGFISGLGRSPGGEHGNPLQYSCLENPMDRKA